MDPHVLKKLNSYKQKRCAVAIVTDLVDGRDRVVVEGDKVGGELGEAVAKAFASGRPATCKVSGSEFFINVHVPATRIVVVGAVHISQALARMASVAGFDLEVIDPRTAFATPERFEGVQLESEWPEDVLNQRPLDRYCAMVAVTHDPKIDDWPIGQALKSGCFYVGALGSRKTHATRVERLLASGLSQEQIDRIQAPIGIDIGASSPQEIAVAILAEIVAALRKRDLGGQQQ